MCENFAAMNHRSCAFGSRLSQLGGVLLWLSSSQAFAQVSVHVGAAPPPSQPVVVSAPVASVQQLSSSAVAGGGPPVEVRLTANRFGVQLQQLRAMTQVGRTWTNKDGSTGSTVDDKETWTPVCQAPCTISVDSAASYRIGGDDVKRSSRFMLPTGMAPISLQTSAGNAHAYRAGVALMSIGSVVTLGGILALLFVSPSRRFDPMTNQVVSTDYTGPLVVGLLPAALGLATLGGGVALYLLNRTSVRLEGGMRLATLGRGLYLSPQGLAF